MGTIDSSNDERHLAIAANVERLLSDAYVLLERGSSGTALATAILAFEEAGKGERLWTDLQRPKNVKRYSWHRFRQEVAAFVLFASLLQKYGLSLPKLDSKTARHFEERFSGKKDFRELLHEPIPQDILRWLLEQEFAGYEGLSNDDQVMLGIEIRWVRKVFIAVISGKAEVERQSGLYVDVEGIDVRVDPSGTTKARAAYWISVAERSLRILRDGAFAEPYGQLATYMETLPRPLPPLADLDEKIRKLENEGDE